MYSIGSCRREGGRRDKIPGDTPLWCLDGGGGIEGYLKSTIENVSP